MYAKTRAQEDKNVSKKIVSLLRIQVLFDHNQHHWKLELVEQATDLLA